MGVITCALIVPDYLRLSIVPTIRPAFRSICSHGLKSSSRSGRPLNLVLVPTSTPDLACKEKAVHWNDVDLDYTF